MSKTLRESARRFGGQVKGFDAVIGELATDSRKNLKGKTFVALRGERFDGHDYLEAATAAGVNAFITEREVVGAACWVVADGRRAIGQLAVAHRERFSPKMLAITGSCGKSTVKEMTSDILRAFLARTQKSGQVLQTTGNRNGDIGVPLSLLELEEHHKMAVIEVGASCIGGIRYLSGLVRPDIAVITNIGPSHLQGFGDVAGVAREKGALIASLSAKGCAVLQADQPFFDELRSCGPASCLTWSLNGPADVRGHWQDEKQILKLRCKPKHVNGGSAEVSCKLPLPGRAAAANATTAATAALAAGASLDDAAQALADFRGLPGRLSFNRSVDGLLLIDDSYNSNPLSAGAALEVLQKASSPHHWLALGDMAELGEQSASFHAKLGESARASGVERLFALGNNSKHAVQAFGKGAVLCAGMPDMAARITSSIKAEASAANSSWCQGKAGVALLVKGSRSSAMERLVKMIENDGQNGT